MANVTLLVASTGSYFLETVHRARPLFYLVTPQETTFTQLNDVPDYVNQATTFFILLYVAEYVYLHLMSRSSNARINEAITSAGCGLLMRTTFLLCGNFDKITYFWLYEKISLGKLPVNSAWTWWICFFAMDFAYYWMHRCSHGVLLADGHCNTSTSISRALAIQPFVPILDTYRDYRKVGAFGMGVKYPQSSQSSPRFLVNAGRNRYCIDKNYGGTLIVWDRLFRTFEAEKEEVVYGLVHGMQSYNPIYIQFCHLSYIWHMLYQSSTWSERLSILFKGPSWSPGKPRLGLIEDIPDVHAPVQKYNCSNNKLVTIYLFLHFSVSVVCYQEAYVRQTGLSMFTVTGFMIYILLSLTAIGATFDGKLYAPFLHFLCAAMFLIGHTFVGQPSFLEDPYNRWLSIVLCWYFYAILAFWGLPAVTYLVLKF